MNRLIRTLIIIVLLGVSSLNGWSQNSDCSVCGEFSWGNGFVIYILRINPDCSFEYKHFWDLGGWRPTTYGTWRDSANIILLSTELQPSIVWAKEESIKQDSVTFSFFDEDTTDITADIVGSLGIVANGSPQELDIDWGDHDLRKRRSLQGFAGDKMVVVLKSKASELQPIELIEIHVDGIISTYKVGNPNSNSFHFGLEASASELRKFRQYQCCRRYLKDEPFMFRKDSYFMRNPETGSFDFARPLTRRR